jgi:hypothetical protein
MVKMVILLAAALLAVSYMIYDSNQVTIFLELKSPSFVLAGGVAMFFAVPADRENLLIERLEAFRNGCIHFGVIGVLIGFIAIMASMDNPKMLGPAVALLTLLWAVCLNYIAKLVVISKSNGG